MMLNSNLLCDISFWPRSNWQTLQASEAFLKLLTSSCTTQAGHVVSGSTCMLSSISFSDFIRRIWDHHHRIWVCRQNTHEYCTFLVIYSINNATSHNLESVYGQLGPHKLQDGGEYLHFSSMESWMLLSLKIIAIQVSVVGFEQWPRQMQLHGIKWCIISVSAATHCLHFTVSSRTAAAGQ